MSQVSYGTITINDLTDITDVYLEYALVSDIITRAEDIPSGTQWSTTYPTWVSGQQIWIRRVTRKEGIDMPEYGTPYLDKAVSQIQNNYIGLSNKLRTFFYPGDSTYSGAFAVSKTSTDGLNTANANTYGFNARVASALISIGYNKIPLLEMGLLGDNFNGIKLYSPILTNNVITGNRLDATLTSEGLKLLKGGIEAGEPGNNDFIYLSTNVYNKSPAINIGTNANNWRQIIGSNFGVTTNGALYSTEARIGNNDSYMSFITQVDYILTQDSSVDASKTYYIYDDNTDTYVAINNPSGNPSSKNPPWFEQIPNGATLELVGSSIFIGDQNLASVIDNKANSNTVLTLDSIIQPQDWKDRFWEYKLTEDVLLTDESKQYYQYIFLLTSDTTIVSDKAYYTYTPQNGNDYYTLVTNPQSSELSFYYERENDFQEYSFNNLNNVNPQSLELYELIENNNNYISTFLTSHLSINSEGLDILDKNSRYQIALRNDGLYIIEKSSDNSSGTVVSKFGANIEFSDNKEQRIGNDETYMRFKPATYSLTTDTTVVANKTYYLINNDNTYLEIESPTGNPQSNGWYECSEPSSLEIIASNLRIGTNSINNFLADTEQHFINSDNTLSQYGEAIDNHSKTLTDYGGYIDVNTTVGYIRVGNLSSESYVQIQGSTPGDNEGAKVAIKINEKDVAFMSGKRFYAPDAVVTNLYMKREENEVYQGDIGWVMRSNGHLSLKLIK